MSNGDLERTLKELVRIGKRVKARPYRQVWRFEFGGKPYYLKFYPRRGAAMKRLVRGNPAMREFLNLQAMQKAGVPSPRAVAHLAGFKLEDQKGDAVIIEGIEPSVQLDRYLSDLALRGQGAAEHRRLAQQVIDIVQKLGQAKLTHTDLHLGNFLLRDDKVYLLDGYAVRRGAVRRKDLLLLAHSVSRSATTADLVRAWQTLSSAPVPPRNDVRPRQWRKLVDYSTGENDYFGRLQAQGWGGWFYKHCKFPRRWAPASQIDVTHTDWQQEWPKLRRRMEADEFEVLKRSRGGDVLAGRIFLGGREVEVIIKRPRRRYWHRYINEIGRGGRARRAWKKAWGLVAREIPTAWPLLMMERRRLGYVIDAVIIFERVDGTLLSSLDLDAMTQEHRMTLFRRLGRTLRQLEAAGRVQYDSKMTNWMIRSDPVLGPVPVVIDVDGIRRWWWPLWSIERLLRSMRDHAQYRPEDSRELCLGYAPFAKLAREPAPAEPQ